MDYLNVHIILLLVLILRQYDGLNGRKTGRYQIQRHVIVVHNKYILFVEAIYICVCVCLYVLFHKPWYNMVSYHHDYCRVITHFFHRSMHCFPTLLNVMR